MRNFFAWLLVCACVCATLPALAQTTLTVNSATTWSALVASTTTNIALDSITLSTGGSLALDGTNNSYTCAGIGPTIATSTGVLVVAGSVTGPVTLTCGTLQGGDSASFITVGSTAFTLNVGSGIANSNPSKNTVVVGAGTATINVTTSLSGSGSSGYFATVAGGSLSINGGTLQGTGAATCIDVSYGTASLSGCTLVSGTVGGLAVTSGGTTILTDCNFVVAEGTTTTFPMYGGKWYVVASLASNYVSLPTSSAAGVSPNVHFPAAAHVMGPWPITNSASGTAKQIGPFPITTAPNGNCSVGPYPVK
jgi:hypothetical protein